MSLRARWCNALHLPIARPRPCHCYCSIAFTRILVPFCDGLCGRSSLSVPASNDCIVHVVLFPRSPSPFDCCDSDKCRCSSSCDPAAECHALRAWCSICSSLLSLNHFLQQGPRKCFFHRRASFVAPRSQHCRLECRMQRKRAQHEGKGRSVEQEESEIGVIVRSTCMEVQ